MLFSDQWCEHGIQVSGVDGERSVKSGRGYSKFGLWKNEIVQRRQQAVTWDFCS